MNKQIIDVFDISYEGAGVGKIDGKVVFVPKTLEKEKIEIDIIKKTNSFMIGKVVDVVVESPRRKVAPCPYYDICGGCDFQHCDYDYEKSLKKDILKRELKKVGFEEKIEIVESENRYGYRNKIKLEVRENKLGYYKPNSRDFFPIEKCIIATEKINKIFSLIEIFLKNNQLKNLKSVYIKQIESKISICFLFDKNEKYSSKNIKDLEIFDEIAVYFAYGEVLESDLTKIYNVYGSANLTKTIGSFTFQFDISSFNQINDFVADKLYLYICQKTENKRVVNAYSGQGLLTFLMAQKSKFVYGIEYQKSAHESAEKIKEKITSYKIENVCGKVEECLKDILMRDSIDVLVLDPAREGCHQNVLTEIMNSKIKEVIYVSCNFATLVRDLKQITENYELKNVQIFDMFPCTANMETVAILQRKSHFSN